MAVLQIATASRCKICQHARRADIEILLEKRSRHERDENGERINLEYVKRKMAEFGVPNPTDENVKNHVQKHLEFVDDTIQAQAIQASQQKAKEMRAAREGGSVEADLRWIIDVGIGEVEERVARGEKSGVTLDHVMKAAAELSRRSHSESQRELLGALVGGIASALPGRPMKQLNDGEIIDAEVIEE